MMIFTTHAPLWRMACVGVSLFFMTSQTKIVEAQQSNVRLSSCSNALYNDNSDTLFIGEFHTYILTMATSELLIRGDVNTFDGSRLKQEMIDDQNFYRFDYQSKLPPYNVIPNPTLNIFYMYACDNQSDTPSQAITTFCSTDNDGNYLYQGLPPNSLAIPLSQMNDRERALRRLCNRFATNWDGLVRNTELYYREQGYITGGTPPIIEEEDDSNTDVDGDATDNTDNGTNDPVIVTPVVDETTENNNNEEEEVENNNEEEEEEPVVVEQTTTETGSTLKDKLESNMGQNEATNTNNEEEEVTEKENEEETVKDEYDHDEEYYDEKYNDDQYYDNYYYDDDDDAEARENYYDEDTPVKDNLENNASSPSTTTNVVHESEDNPTFKKPERNPTPVAAMSSEPDTRNGLSKGAWAGIITGIVVGSCFILTLCGCLMVKCCCKKSKKPKEIESFDNEKDAIEDDVTVDMGDGTTTPRAAAAAHAGVAVESDTSSDDSSDSNNDMMNNDFTNDDDNDDDDDNDANDNDEEMEYHDVVISPISRMKSTDSSMSFDREAIEMQCQSFESSYSTSMKFRSPRSKPTKIDEDGFPLENVVEEEEDENWENEEDTYIINQPQEDDDEETTSASAMIPNEPFSPSSVEHGGDDDDDDDDNNNGHPQHKIHESPSDGILV